MVLHVKYTREISGHLELWNSENLEHEKLAGQLFVFQIYLDIWNKKTMKTRSGTDLDVPDIWISGTKARKLNYGRHPVTNDLRTQNRERER